MTSTAVNFNMYCMVKLKIVEFLFADTDTIVAHYKTKVYNMQSTNWEEAPIVDIRPGGNLVPKAICLHGLKVGEIGPCIGW